MKLVKNILYFILSIQEKMLKKSLDKTLDVKNNSRHKRFYYKGSLLCLDSVSDSEKQKMEEELALILKSCGYNPLEVLKYIEGHGTKVYYVNHLKSITAIGEQPGFIYPHKGVKALCLSLLTEKKFVFKTDEIFLFPKGDIDRYYFMYHFYNWYTFKHGIRGIDAKSQELLNKYLIDSSNANINKLQLSEIYLLKDAIKQDKSAIDFVIKLCRDSEGAKNALNKIKNSGASL